MYTVKFYMESFIQFLCVPMLSINLITINSLYKRSRCHRMCHRIWRRPLINCTETHWTHTHTHTRIHACVSYMCNRKAVLNESVSLSTSSLLSSGYLEVYANTCVYSVCFDDRSLFNGNSLLHNPLAAAANNVCLTRQKV